LPNLHRREPNPVPSSGDGVFGSAIRAEWIDFGLPTVELGGVHFSRVSWAWSNASGARAAPLQPR